MKFNESILNETYLEIQAFGPKDVHFEYDVEFNINGILFKASKLLTVITQRPYGYVEEDKQDYAESNIIECEVLQHEYNDYLLPNRENITLSLNNRDREENTILGNSVKESGKTYKAFLRDVEDDVLELEYENFIDGQARDLKGPRRIFLELIDPAVEQIRTMTTGGILRNLTLADAAQIYLMSTLAQLNVPEENLIRGVDISPEFNETIFDHVIVEHFTLLGKLPFYLQDRCGGFYKSGIGAFIQNGIWYLFPRFNTGRFDSFEDKLTVINLPENKYPSIERTFKVDGKAVTILCTGKTKLTDESQFNQINLGNGFRYADAEVLFDEGFTVLENTATFLRSENIKEYVTNEREDGLNYIRTSDARILSNDFKQTTRLAEGIGRYIEVTWEHADPDLLYPGMPVMYVYETGTEVSFIYGILHASYIEKTYFKSETNKNRMKCDVRLLIYVESQNV